MLPSLGRANAVTIPSDHGQYGEAGPSRVYCKLCSTRIDQARNSGHCRDCEMVLPLIAESLLPDIARLAKNMSLRLPTLVTQLISYAWTTGFQKEFAAFNNGAISDEHGNTFSPGSGWIKVPGAPWPTPLNVGMSQPLNVGHGGTGPSDVGRAAIADIRRRLTDVADTSRSPGKEEAPTHA